MKKVLLAYSGWLDTSFCIPYLMDKWYEVITVIVNTGWFSKWELKDIKLSSKKYWAIKHYEIDARDSLFDQFGKYLIKSNYLKWWTYPACVSPERIVISYEIADIAKKEKIKIIAHWSTWAWNDQVRFDIAMKALIKNVVILAPIRDEWLSREQELDFLKSKWFDIKTWWKDYSINVWLLWTTIWWKETLDTKQLLPDKAFPSIKKTDDCSLKWEVVKLSFKKWLPVWLNWKNKKWSEIVQVLNDIWARNWFGKDYHIWTTIIWLKGRIWFEAPWMKMLIKAHLELEKIILTSKQIFWKNTLWSLYWDLIHEWLYFDPIVKDLEAFMDSSNKFVEGEVQIKVRKWHIEIVSLESKYSQFDLEKWKYWEESSMWTWNDVKWFINIYWFESVSAFHKQGG